MRGRGGVRLALAAVLTMVAASVTGSAGTVVPRDTVLPIAHMAAAYADDFLLPAPGGDTPEARALWLTEEFSARGKTPNEWIDLATSLSVEARDTGAAPADLAIEVLRVYATVGLDATPATTRAIEHAAEGLPASLRGSFAELVRVVADAAVAQAPITAAVQARALAGIDPLAKDVLLEQYERDIMIASQDGILVAIGAFRARTADIFEQMDPAPYGAPLFEDPEGLIVLGDTGDSTYVRAGVFPDPMLLVDPAGNDRYENSAGGACPAMPTETILGSLWMKCNLLGVSVVADLGDDVTASSDDVYAYSGDPAPVQGAGGPGAIGILVDVAGDDTYDALLTRRDQRPFVPIQYYFDAGAQGYGFGGLGLLLDPAGNDRYDFKIDSTHGHHAWGFAQGFGGLGGIGLAADGSGDDEWLTTGLGLDGYGFEGLYTNGTGFFGGVGVQTDTGLGNDVYRSSVTAQTVDYYALGFGAFGGVGILYEDGGDDDYYTYEEGYDPWIDPMLNCAYGTGSLAGAGIMIEAGGNDVYYGGTTSPKTATVMDFGWGGPGTAYGLFVDSGGDDVYQMEADGGNGEYIGGYGYWEEPEQYNIDIFEALFGSGPLGHNTFGAFVDIGGNDTYTQLTNVPGGVGNDSQWAFGVDRGV